MDKLEAGSRRPGWRRLGITLALLLVLGVGGGLLALESSAQWRAGPSAKSWPVAVTPRVTASDPALLQEVWKAEAGPGVGDYDRFLSPWIAVDRDSGFALVRTDAKLWDAGLLAVGPDGSVKALPGLWGHPKALAVSPEGALACAAVRDQKYPDGGKLRMAWLGPDGQSLWDREFSFDSQGAITLPVTLSLSPDGQVLLAGFPKPGLGGAGSIQTVAQILPDGASSDLPGGPNRLWAADWPDGCFLVSREAEAGMVLELVSAPDLRVVAETKVGRALGQHPIPFATGERGSRWWIATENGIALLSPKLAPLVSHDLSAPELAVAPDGWCVAWGHDTVSLYDPRGIQAWTRTEPALAAMTTDGGHLTFVVFGSGETVGKRGLEAIDASGQTIWAQDIALGDGVTPLVVSPRRGWAVVLGLPESALFLNFDPDKRALAAQELRLAAPLRYQESYVCRGGRYVLLVSEDYSEALFYDLAGKVEELLGR